MAGNTSIITEALSHALGVPSSHTSYSKLTLPTKSVGGVKVKLPVELISKVPTAGAILGFVLTTRLSPSGSKSLAIKLPVRAKSFSCVKLSATATILLLSVCVLSITSTETVAVSHSTGLPLSHTSYWKLASPVNPGVGVKVYSPKSSMLTVPLLVFIGVVLTLRECSSTSKSLVKTLPVVGVSNKVRLISSNAFGASLIGNTSIATIRVSHNPVWSQTSTHISSVPVKLAPGVKLRQVSLVMLSIVIEAEPLSGCAQRLAVCVSIGLASITSPQTVTGCSSGVTTGGITTIGA